MYLEDKGIKPISLGSTVEIQDSQFWLAEPQQNHSYRGGNVPFFY